MSPLRLKWSIGDGATARRRAGPPDNEVPCAVPISVLLARSDDVAVAVAGLRVFTTGASFDLAVRFRIRPSGLRGHELHHLVTGRRLGDDTGDPDKLLLLGVEYADGRTATTVPAPWRAEGPMDDDQAMMSPSSGGGGYLSYDQTFWLSPVPPDGPLSFVCAWPALGIPETHRVIEDIPETHRVIEDANLAQASRAAIVLWPPQPPEQPARSHFSKTCRAMVGSQQPSAGPTTSPSVVRRLFVS